MSDPQPLHATLVARYASEGWRGALIRGPSGAGKSTLALALIGQGWRLVGDDRVLVWRSGERAWGRAPKALRGLLEVRGVGVLPFPALEFAQITHVIEARPAGGEIERIPAPTAVVLCGANLPACTLDLIEPHAAAKIAAFCHGLHL